MLNNYGEPGNGFNNHGQTTRPSDSQKQQNIGPAWSYNTQLDGLYYPEHQPMFVGHFDANTKNYPQYPTGTIHQPMPTPVVKCHEACCQHLNDRYPINPAPLRYPPTSSVQPPRYGEIPNNDSRQYFTERRPMQPSISRKKVYQTDNGYPAIPERHFSQYVGRGQLHMPESRQSMQMMRAQYPMYPHYWSQRWAGPRMNCPPPPPYHQSVTNQGTQLQGLKMTEPSHYIDPSLQKPISSQHRRGMMPGNGCSEVLRPVPDSKRPTVDGNLQGCYDYGYTTGFVPFNEVNKISSNSLSSQVNNSTCKIPTDKQFHPHQLQYSVQGSDRGMVNCNNPMSDIGYSMNYPIPNNESYIRGSMDDPQQMGGDARKLSLQYEQSLGKKRPDLDVRQFLATWDCDEDESTRMSEPLAGASSGAPYIVVDCRSLEGDAAAKMQERFKSSSGQVCAPKPRTSSPNTERKRTDEISVQEENPDRSGIHSEFHPQNTFVPSMPGLLAESDKNINFWNSSGREAGEGIIGKGGAFQPLDCTKRDNILEPILPTKRDSHQHNDIVAHKLLGANDTSHMSLDALVSYYGDNRRMMDGGYDLVEMTERIVNASDKISTTDRVSMEHQMTSEMSRPCDPRLQQSQLGNNPASIYNKVTPRYPTNSYQHYKPGGPSEPYFNYKHPIGSSKFFGFESSHGMEPSNYEYYKANADFENHRLYGSKEGPKDPRKTLNQEMDKTQTIYVDPRKCQTSDCFQEKSNMEFSGVDPEQYIPPIVIKKAEKLHGVDKSSSIRDRMDAINNEAPHPNGQLEKTVLITSQNGPPEIFKVPYTPDKEFSHKDNVVTLHSGDQTKSNTMTVEVPYVQQYSSLVKLSEEMSRDGKIETACSEQKNSSDSTSVNSETAKGEFKKPTSFKLKRLPNSKEWKVEEKGNKNSIAKKQSVESCQNLDNCNLKEEDKNAPTSEVSVILNMPSLDDIRDGDVVNGENSKSPNQNEIIKSKPFELPTKTGVVNDSSISTVVQTPQMAIVQPMKPVQPTDTLNTEQEVNLQKDQPDGKESKISCDFDSSNKQLSGNSNFTIAPDKEDTPSESSYSQIEGTYNTLILEKPNDSSFDEKHDFGIDIKENEPAVANDGTDIGLIPDTKSKHDNFRSHKKIQNVGNYSRSLSNCLVAESEDYLHAEELTPDMAQEVSKVTFSPFHVYSDCDMNSQISDYFKIDSRISGDDKLLEPRMPSSPGVEEMFEDINRPSQDHLFPDKSCELQELNDTTMTSMTNPNHQLQPFSSMFEESRDKNNMACVSVLRETPKTVLSDGEFPDKHGMFNHRAVSSDEESVHLKRLSFDSEASKMSPPIPPISLKLNETKKVWCITKKDFDSDCTSSPKDYSQSDENQSVKKSPQIKYSKSFEGIQDDASLHRSTAGTCKREEVSMEITSNETQNLTLEVHEQGSLKVFTEDSLTNVIMNVSGAKNVKGEQMNECSSYDESTCSGVPLISYVDHEANRESDAMVSLVNNCRTIIKYTAIHKLWRTYWTMGGNSRNVLVFDQLGTHFPMSSVSEKDGTILKPYCSGSKQQKMEVTDGDCSKHFKVGYQETRDSPSSIQTEMSIAMDTSDFSKSSESEELANKLNTAVADSAVNYLTDCDVPSKKFKLSEVNFGLIEMSSDINSDIVCDFETHLNLNSEISMAEVVVHVPEDMCVPSEVHSSHDITIIEKELIRKIFNQSEPQKIEDNGYQNELTCIPNSDTKSLQDISEVENNCAQITSIVPDRKPEGKETELNNDDLEKQTSEATADNANIEDYSVTKEMNDDNMDEEMFKGFASPSCKVTDEQDNQTDKIIFEIDAALELMGLSGSSTAEAQANGTGEGNQVIDTERTMIETDNLSCLENNCDMDNVFNSEQICGDKREKEKCTFQNHSKNAFESKQKKTDPENYHEIPSKIEFILDEQSVLKDTLENVIANKEDCKDVIRTTDYAQEGTVINTMGAPISSQHFPIRESSSKLTDTGDSIANIMEKTLNVQAICAEFVGDNIIQPGVKEVDTKSLESDKFQNEEKNKKLKVNINDLGEKANDDGMADSDDKINNDVLHDEPSRKEHNQELSELLPKVLTELPKITNSQSQFGISTVTRRSQNSDTVMESDVAKPETLREQESDNMAIDIKCDSNEESTKSKILQTQETSNIESKVVSTIIQIEYNTQSSDDLELEKETSVIVKAQTNNENKSNGSEIKTYMCEEEPIENKMYGDLDSPHHATEEIHAEHCVKRSDPSSNVTETNITISGVADNKEVNNASQSVLIEHNASNMSKDEQSLSSDTDMNHDSRLAEIIKEEINNDSMQRLVEISATTGESTLNGSCIDQMYVIEGQSCRGSPKEDVSEKDEEKLLEKSLEKDCSIHDCMSIDEASYISTAVDDKQEGGIEISHKTRDVITTEDDLGEINSNPTECDAVRATVDNETLFGTYNPTRPINEVDGSKNINIAANNHSGTSSLMDIEPDLTASLMDIEPDLTASLMDIEPDLTASLIYCASETLFVNFNSEISTIEILQNEKGSYFYDFLKCKWNKYDKRWLCNSTTQATLSCTEFNKVQSISKHTLTGKCKTTENEMISHKTELSLLENVDFDATFCRRGENINIIERASFKHSNVSVNSCINNLNHGFGKENLLQVLEEVLQVDENFENGAYSKKKNAEYNKQNLSRELIKLPSIPIQDFNDKGSKHLNCEVMCDKNTNITSMDKIVARNLSLNSDTIQSLNLKDNQVNNKPFHSDFNKTISTITDSSMQTEKTLFKASDPEVALRQMFSDDDSDNAKSNPKQFINDCYKSDENLQLVLNRENNLDETCNKLAHKSTESDGLVIYSDNYDRTKELNCNLKNIDQDTALVAPANTKTNVVPEKIDISNHEQFSTNKINSIHEKSHNPNCMLGDDYSQRRSVNITMSYSNAIMETNKCMESDSFPLQCLVEAALALESADSEELLNRSNLSKLYSLSHDKKNDNNKVTPISDREIPKGSTVKDNNKAKLSETDVEIFKKFEETNYNLRASTRIVTSSSSNIIPYSKRKYTSRSIKRTDGEIGLHTGNNSLLRKQQKPEVLNQDKIRPKKRKAPLYPKSKRRKKIAKCKQKDVSSMKLDHLNFQIDEETTVNYGSEDEHGDKSRSSENVGSEIVVINKLNKVPNEELRNKVSTVIPNSCKDITNTLQTCTGTDVQDSGTDCGKEAVLQDLNNTFVVASNSGQIEDKIFCVHVNSHKMDEYVSKLNLTDVEIISDQVNNCSDKTEDVINLSKTSDVALETGTSLVIIIEEVETNSELKNDDDKPKPDSEIILVGPSEDVNCNMPISHSFLCEGTGSNAHYFEDTSCVCPPIPEADIVKVPDNDITTVCKDKSGLTTSTNCIQDEIFANNCYEQINVNLVNDIGNWPFVEEEVAHFDNKPDLPNSIPEEGRKFELKCSLPWERIFNICKSKKRKRNKPPKKINGLELGPAKIEVRLGSSSAEWEVVSNLRKNASPVVKVKRLILQRDPELSSSYSEKESEEENELRLRRHSSQSSDESDATMNKKDYSTDHTSFHVSDDENWQPVVILTRNKKLDQLTKKLEENANCQSESFGLVNVDRSEYEEDYLNSEPTEKENKCSDAEADENTSDHVENSRSENLFNHNSNPYRPGSSFMGTYKSKLDKIPDDFMKGACYEEDLNKESNHSKLPLVPSISKEVSDKPQEEVNADIEHPEYSPCSNKSSDDPASFNDALENTNYDSENSADENYFLNDSSSCAINVSGNQVDVTLNDNIFKSPCNLVEDESKSSTNNLGTEDSITSSEDNMHDNMTNHSDSASEDKEELAHIPETSTELTDSFSLVTETFSFSVSEHLQTTGDMIGVSSTRPVCIGQCSNTKKNHLCQSTNFEETIPEDLFGDTMLKEPADENNTANEIFKECNSICEASLNQDVESKKLNQDVERKNISSKKICCYGERRKKSKRKMPKNFFVRRKWRKEGNTHHREQTCYEGIKENSNSSDTSSVDSEEVQTQEEHAIPSIQSDSEEHEWNGLHKTDDSPGSLSTPGIRYRNRKVSSEDCVSEQCEVNGVINRQTRDSDVSSECGNARLQGVYDTEDSSPVRINDSPVRERFEEKQRLRNRGRGLKRPSEGHSKEDTKRRRWRHETTNYPYRCQKCRIGFETKDEMNRHQESRHAPRRELHHCLLCQRSFSSLLRHRLHLQGRSHRHLELTQRHTMHAMHRLLTGRDYPRIRPLSHSELQALDWRPDQPGCTHFYHEPTPLQAALQEHVTMLGELNDEAQSEDMNIK